MITTSVNASVPGGASGVRHCARAGCRLTATTTATWHQGRAPETVDVCAAHAREVEAADRCSECPPDSPARAARLGLCVDHLPVSAVRRTPQPEETAPVERPAAPTPPGEGTAAVPSVPEIPVPPLRSRSPRPRPAEPDPEDDIEELQVLPRAVGAPQPTLTAQEKARLSLAALHAACGPLPDLDPGAILAERQAEREQVVRGDPTAAEVELEDLRARVEALERRPAETEGLVAAICDEAGIPIGPLAWRLGYLQRHLQALRWQAELGRAR